MTDYVIPVGVVCLERHRRVCADNKQPKTKQITAELDCCSHLYKNKLIKKCIQEQVPLKCVLVVRKITVYSSDIGVTVRKQ